MKNFIYLLLGAIIFVWIMIIFSARDIIWNSIFSPSIVFVENQVEEILPIIDTDIHYINKKHNYCFSYPEELKLDVVNIDEDIVNIQGENLLISVQAFKKIDNSNLLDFSHAMSLSIIGEILEENKGNSEKNAMLIFDYNNPNSKAIFWEDNDYQFFLSISGENYKRFMQENDFIQNLYVNSNNCN